MRMLLTLWGMSLLLACGGKEASRVELEVKTAPLPATAFTSDLGYSVTVTRARLALTSLEFTVEGEEHASLWRRSTDWLIGTAHAHPGHAAGGVVTGELTGPLLVELSHEETLLGRATLLTGDYSGANLGFRSAEELAEADALRGHTVQLEGTALREGKSVAFSLLVDAPGSRVVGAPFELTVEPSSTQVLRLELRPAGARSTLFDLIDFHALDEDEDGVLQLPAESAEGGVLRRALQSHEFWTVNPQ